MAGRRDWWRSEARAVASVSYTGDIISAFARECYLSLPLPSEEEKSGSAKQREKRTFPGTNRLTPLANGANLTSTFNRAFALKGAEGGVGFGP